MRNLKILMIITFVITSTVIGFAVYTIDTLLEPETTILPLEPETTTTPLLPETEQKQQYSFVRAWGSEGSENGQLDGPEGVAIDSSNNVYVTDVSRIQKFSSNGTFITYWGSYGSGTGQFDGPRGVAIDSSDNVYVVDTRNNRTQVFASST